MKDAIAVIQRARLDATLCTGQVELAAQAAVDAGIGQQFGHERRGFRPAFVTVHAAMHAAGIHAGQEAGSAGRAYGALAEGVRKGHTLLNEAVYVWRMDELVAKGADRVVALLVSTDPQDVGRHQARSSGSRYTPTRWLVLGTSPQFV